MSATLQAGQLLHRAPAPPTSRGHTRSGRPSRRRRASVVLAAAEQGDQPPQQQPGGLPPLPPRADLDAIEDRLWVSLRIGCIPFSWCGIPWPTYKVCASDSRAQQRRRKRRQHGDRTQQSSQSRSVAPFLPTAAWLHWGQRLLGSLLCSSACTCFLPCLSAAGPGHP